jgi:carbon starvation protein
LLAAVALAVTSSMIINMGKERYVWVTMVPMVFVAATTLTAGWLNVTDNYWPLTQNPATAMPGTINIVLTVLMMVCAVIVLFEAGKRWYRIIVKGQDPGSMGGTMNAPKQGTPPFRCC